MNDLKKASEIIKKGGIVIFPTDTAYGIGCRIDDGPAVKKLFKIRRRPVQQATPVLFDSIKRVEEYVLPFDSNLEDLMKHYWPGALTIVLKARVEKIPEMVRGGTDTLGVRIPDNSIINRLIALSGSPILGPSANFHGERTPYSFEELDPNLIKKADIVLKGEIKIKKASTVVDCTINPWKILRQGAIDLKL